MSSATDDYDNRCFAIGRSHSFQGNTKNALALFSRASDLATSIQRNATGLTSNGGPPRLDVSLEEIQFLVATSQGLEAKYRGLVILDKLSERRQEVSRSQVPLVERMDEYAVDSVDLNNLVPFPPKMRPIPVKPLFLDVAWNYIQYPREKADKPEAASTETRRGWFGFGR